MSKGILLVLTTVLTELINLAMLTRGWALSVCDATVSLWVKQRYQQYTTALTTVLALALA